MDNKISATNQQQPRTLPVNPKGKLDREDFLKILVTQMQNQDPSAPMQDREFVAQMAQFSQMENISTMATYQKQMLEKFSRMEQFFSGQSQLSQFAQFIDREVSWLDDSGQMQKGLVTAASIAEGLGYVTVNNKKIPVNQLIEVKNK